MTTHLEFETLSAYADGELGERQRRRADSHLHDCLTCQQTLERIQSLVQSAAALPRDAVPPGDVWTGIRRGMRPRARRFAWILPALLGAAAVLVVMVGVQAARPGRSAKVMSSAPATAVGTLASVDRNYAASIADLRATLEQRRARLSPATVRVLEQSLAAIDAAIAEARAALAADPANSALAELLAVQYEHKLELLQRVARLSSTS